MRICPACSIAYPDDVRFCANDGATLDDGPAGALALTALGPGDVRDTPHAAPPADVIDPDPFIGKSLGLYKIIEPLGRGGMGVVYVAEHVHLGKRFALKVLTRAVSRSKSAIERLKQEAVAASRIDHDNIVDVVNFDETPEGDFFIVMELLRGTSLGDEIKKGPLPLERALRVAIQIARALHAAHDKGIIHRDVKPENVFLCAREEGELVKVLDFGISKVRDDDAERVRMTKTGELVGTPLYMSPEQARGETNLDARVDVYALGVIVYEMLTGRTPFTGENYFQLLWKHSNEAPPRLSSSGLTIPVPPDLDAVVERALAKEPDQRFASMKEVHDALVAVAVSCGFPWLSPAGRDSGASATRRPALSVPAPVVRRGPSQAVVAAAGAVAMGLGAAGLIWQLLAPSGASSTERADVVERPGGHSLPAEPQRGPEPEPAPPVPAPETIAVSLTSTPPGAEVFRGEHRVGATPIIDRLPRSDGAVEYRFVLPGHQPTTESVVPSEDRTLRVHLRASRRGPGGSGGPPVGIKTSL
jgi:serine/threonine-protein kinase